VTYPAINLLPTGRYMDGPEKGRTFTAGADNPRYVTVRYRSSPDVYDEIVYELKWWQWPNGDREARYHLNEESASRYRLRPEWYVRERPAMPCNGASMSGVVTKHY
jgi:hypothetical protein